MQLVFFFFFFFFFFGYCAEVCHKQRKHVPTLTARQHYNGGMAQMHADDLLFEQRCMKGKACAHLAAFNKIITEHELSSKLLCRRRCHVEKRCDQPLGQVGLR